MTREKEPAGGRRPIWVDWILLFAFAVILFFGVRFFLERRQRAEADILTEYVICISSQSQLWADENVGWNVLIPYGTSVSSANGTADMGYVTSLEVRTHQVATVRAKKLVFIEHEGYSDLYITVRGLAVRGEGDCLRISDIRVAAGEAGDFLVGSFFAGNATVVSVKEVVS